MSDCGATSESCCTSLPVPGGTYYRTYTNNGDGGSGEADPATVSAFRLDKYEVTVGRFRQFVQAVYPPDGGAGWLPPNGSGKHTHLNGGLGLANVGNTYWGPYEPGFQRLYDNPVAPTDANLGSCDAESTWTATAGSNENLPVNCVTWSEAYAFCIWDGGFLPSEAEWELAAGGAQELEYPWGSADPGSNNQYAIYDCYLDSPDAGCFFGGPRGVTAPVGSATLGAGPWGHLDLGGNLDEWALDGYAPYITPCVDCANLSGGSVVRGGDFSNSATYMRSPQRDAALGGRFYAWGFRCARSP
jgi:formylglycine-generating enzyme required for sulfatase activity